MQGNARKRGRRPEDSPPELSNGHPKRHAAAPDVVYQLLCPGSRIGHIIGKGGCNIEQLRQSTKATIKVERDTPGCPDRLICISSTASAAEPLCRAQEALFSIQERLSVMDTSEPLETARLLVPDASVGAMMGDKGETLAELRQSSGASIRVAESHETPKCGRSSDRLVTVTGEPETVRRALRDLSTILRAGNQSRSEDLGPPAFHITAVATSAVQRQPQPDPPSSRHMEPDHRGASRNMDAPDLARLSRADLLSRPSEAPQPVETVLRCLVPAAEIGQVIGPKGKTVQSMRDRSGATIKVHEGNSERKGMDRMVTLSSSGLPGCPVCPAQEALRLVCQACITIPSRPLPTPIRLLVPTEQSGALLGKGGARINQIRSDSGATVRLIGLEPEEERGLPREIGPGQHRILCISGESNCVLRALSTVTDLLRDCQARSQLGAAGRAGGRPPACHMGAAPPSGPGGLPHREHGLRGAYASLSGSPYDSPSSGGDVLFDGPPHMRHGIDTQEHSSRFNPAVGLEPGKLVKELRLVGAQVGCVLGKSGENIGQIRKISGALVKMSDAPKGVSERMLRLTGFPEQVQAAINLVQAFLLAGGAGSLDLAAALTYSTR